MITIGNDCFSLWVSAEALAGKKPHTNTQSVSLKVSVYECSTAVVGNYFFIRKNRIVRIVTKII